MKHFDVYLTVEWEGYRSDHHGVNEYHVTAKTLDSAIKKAKEALRHGSPYKYASSSSAIVCENPNCGKQKIE